MKKRFSDEKIRSLVKLAQAGDIEARNEVWFSQKGSIVTQAQQLKRLPHAWSFTMDDLIGQGYLGVEIAIRTFDHRPGVPFYAYAKTCIRTEIKKLIYKHGYCLSCGRYNRTYPRLEAASGLSESRDPELMVIAEDGELSDPVQATMAKENSEKIAEHMRQALTWRLISGAANVAVKGGRMSQ